MEKEEDLFGFEDLKPSLVEDLFPDFNPPTHTKQDGDRNGKDKDREGKQVRQA